jgi:hypothetical protein
VTGKHVSLNLTAFDRKIRLALQIPLASSEKIGYNRSVEEETHPRRIRRFVSLREVKK